MRYEIPIFLFLFFILFVDIATAQSELDKAIDWLKANQNNDGSWALGIHQEHLTASAMIALYKAREYEAASKASSWLKQQIENFSSAVWKAEEADIPAIVIYSFYATKNETAIDIENVSEKLMSYQSIDNKSKSYGGFIGFKEDMVKPVESSVDTSLSLIALLNYKNFTDRIDITTNFLKKLQNNDGSFNLTFNTKYHPLYSLASDPISLTALASIALSEAGEDDTKAIELLKSSARSCFSDENRSYSAALSAIAFDKIGELEYARAAVNYLRILQKNDGGFSDSMRQNPSISNALDTAWAAIALTSIENTTSDICAPLNTELNLDNEVIQPGETQNISFRILGAISNITIKVSYPNESLIEFPINYRKDITYYEIIFNDTNQIGTYNVSAQITPIYGEFIILNASFETEGEENTTSSTTTPTTTQTPAQQSGSGQPLSYNPTTIITTSTTTTTTNTSQTNTPITTITTAQSTSTTTTSSPLTGMFSLISNYNIAILIASCSCFSILIWKKFFGRRTYQSFYYQRQSNF